MTDIRSQTIAIIGWGSLLWDPDNLTPFVQGQWQLEKGPSLPLEFSRVSPKRKQALALVIDPDDGRWCRPSDITRTRVTVEEAVDDLARRERADMSQIGFVTAATGQCSGRFSSIVDSITQWTELTGIAGAVWTDLPSNFASHTGQAFSMSSAIDHLKGLAPESLEEAKRYISEAPQAVDTPLRQALVAQSWWRGISYS